MRCCFRSLALSAVVAAAVAISAAKASEWPDELVLRRAKVSPEPRRVLGFLRQKCGSDRDLLDITLLIEQLGSSQFDERERATKKLVALGEAALPALGAALGDSDIERARRAARCVRSIGRHPDTAASIAAVRWLARKRVDGAAAVLLRYLPFAPAEAEREEVWYALDSLSSPSGADLAPFVAGLRDRVPLRRAAAGYVVARRGNAERRKAVRALLDDADHEVRLRVAQGLLGAGDGSVVPHLIALLEKAPVPLAWQAEELLRWASAGKGPRQVIGAGSRTSRQAARRAWAAWWKDQPAPPNVANLNRGPARPGLALVWDRERREGKTGRVWLCGCDALPRWQLELKGELCDACFAGDERILLAYRLHPLHDGHISERELTGTVVRTVVPADGVQTIWRLPTGDIAAASVLVVAAYDHAGNKISLWNVSSMGGFPGMPRCPRLGRHGLLGVQVDLPGGLLRLGELDPQTGTILRQCTVRRKKLFRSRDVKAQALPAGGYLLSEPGGNQAIEVDNTGKVVWESPPLRIHDARRLPGGTTLIAGSWRVAEITTAGKVVWEVITDGDAWRVWPCLGLVRLGFDTRRPADLDLDAWVAYRVNGLRDPNAVVRLRSTEALGRLGRKAAEAVPALIATLGDKDQEVSRAVRDALEAVASRQHVPLVAALLRKDRQPRARVAAAYLLAALPFDPKQTVQPLRQALQDESTEVQREAAFALGRLGPRAQPAIPELLAALRKYMGTSDEKVQVARAAACTLGLIGPGAKEAVPTLVLALDHETLQAGATRALGCLGPAAQDVIPRLIRLLGDRNANRYVRRNAAEALGKLGAGQPSALRALIEHSNDPDEQVRPAIATALRKLQAAKPAP